MRRPGGFDRSDPGDDPIPPVEPRERAGRTREAEARGARPVPAPQQPPEPVAGARADEPGDLERTEESSDTQQTVELGGARGSWLARVPKPARTVDPVRAAEQRLRQATRRRRAGQRRERRRFSAESRRRRRNWLIASGTVLALALFVLVGTFTPLMAVREVEVIGAEKVDAAAVEQALSRFEGKPLALVTDGDVHRALEPFPLIQRYAVELVPPHTIRVRIEERVAVLSIEQDGAFGSYDAAGVLLGTAEAPPAGAPLASGKITDLSSEAFTAAARVLRDIPAELREQVSGVSATTAQDVTLTLTSGVQVFWGDAEQNRRKAVVLQTMIASLGERPIQQIDVSSVEAPVFN